jgi:hypothetical protein
MEVAEETFIPEVAEEEPGGKDNLTTETRRTTIQRENDRKAGERLGKRAKNELHDDNRPKMAKGVRSLIGSRAS